MTWRYMEMYNNDYMYAIERNDDYLAHYGIKGMKWGVRKAIESGNARKLSKQYAKAQKKLAKLEKRANSGKKYARRAALLGAGAAAAGGLAAAGTAGVSRGLHGIGAYGSRAVKGIGGAMTNLGNAAGRAASASGNMNPRLRAALGRSAAALKSGGSSVNLAGARMGVGVGRAAEAVSKWGHSDSVSQATRNAAGKYASKIYAIGKPGIMGNEKVRDAARSKIPIISNDMVARIGAGAVGAGLAAGAGYNAYRAATAKRNARKAAEFRNAMNQSFKGTQYANGGAPRQGNRRRKRR